MHNSRGPRRQSYGCLCLKMDHVITAIKAQQHNPQRVSIDLDGEFAFGVSRILAAWLHVGRTLSDAEIAQLQAKRRWKWLTWPHCVLSDYRPRTTNEIETKLTAKALPKTSSRIPSSACAPTACWTTNRFAQTWVENQSAFRPRGARALAFEATPQGGQRRGDCPDSGGDPSRRGTGLPGR